MFSSIKHPYPEIPSSFVEGKENLNIIVDFFSIFAVCNSEDFLVENAINSYNISGFIAPPLQWIYGLASWLHKIQYEGLIDKNVKLNIFLVSERKGFNYVKDRDSTYKGNRKFKDKNLEEKKVSVYEVMNKAVNIVNNAVLNLGVKAFNLGGVEADFCIYKLCEINKGQNNYNLIIGADKDYGQIISSNTHQFRFTRKYMQNNESGYYECVNKKSLFITQHNCVRELLKIESDSIVNGIVFSILLSIIGDSADNIKGVNGVGVKKLTTILNILNEKDKKILIECKSIDMFLNDIEKLIGYDKNIDKDIMKIISGKDSIIANMPKVYFPEVEKFISLKVDLDASIKVILKMIDNKYKKIDVKGFFDYISKLEPSVKNFISR